MHMILKIMICTVLLLCFASSSLYAPFLEFSSEHPSFLGILAVAFFILWGAVSTYSKQNPKLANPIKSADSTDKEKVKKLVMMMRAEDKWKLPANEVKKLKLLFLAFSVTTLPTVFALFIPKQILIKWTIPLQVNAALSLLTILLLLRSKTVKKYIKLQQEFNLELRRRLNANDASTVHKAP